MTHDNLADPTSLRDRLPRPGRNGYIISLLGMYFSILIMFTCYSTRLVSADQPVGLSVSNITYTIIERFETLSLPWFYDGAEHYSRGTDGSILSCLSSSTTSHRQLDLSRQLLPKSATPALGEIGNLFHERSVGMSLSLHPSTLRLYLP